MKHQALNPYCSPAQARFDDELPDRIEFHGEVTSEDLDRLMGVPGIVYVIRILGWIVLAPFLSIPIFVMSSKPNGAIGFQNLVQMDSRVTVNVRWKARACLAIGVLAILDMAINNGAMCLA